MKTRKGTIATRRTGVDSHAGGGDFARPFADESTPLSAYLREVGEHDVLGAEGERRLAARLKEREIAAWQAVFSYAPAVAHVAAGIESVLHESPRHLEELRRAADAARRSRARATQEAFAEQARVAAVAMRAADRERRALDAVIAELERLARQQKSEPLVRGRTGFSRASPRYPAYMERIRTANREATVLRETFVKANLRLVISVAQKYRRRGLAMADLVQEGNLGLMKAVDYFDHERGFRFSTYASWWIRHMIGRAVANTARTVRLPVHMLDSKQRISRVVRDLTARLGRAPSDEEIAAAAGISIAKLASVRQHAAGQEVSLDEPVGEGEQMRIEIFRIPVNENRSVPEVLSLHERAEALGELIDELSPKEADIVRKRFALEGEKEWTLQQIADRYRVSRERIRQIQVEALLKLRHAFEVRERTSPSRES